MNDANEDPMISGSVLGTFVYYAVPSMIGLIALTTSSLVDGIFVGNYVGSEALAAITLLVPIFTVLFAIALMFGIGGSVAASKNLGAGEQGTASAVFSQMMMATAATAVTFAIASYGFEDVLYRTLSVPEQLEPLVSEYFGVIRWVLVIQLTTMVLYYFVRADGHPMLGTTALITGAVGNMSLDALFVIYLDMGLAGAAYAMAISQVLQCGVLATYFLSPSRTLTFSLVQRKWSHLAQASYNGASEFINEISAGLIFWLLNHLLIERLGVDGVAAFSVVNYFVFLSLMLSYGIADALHLLASRSFGARNQQRVQQFLKTAVWCSVAIGAALSLAIVAGRKGVTGWFLGPEDAAVAEEAVQVVLVVWPLFLVNGTNVIMSCYLTAIHQPHSSALIASMRGLILPGCLLIGLHALFERWPFRSHFSDWSFLSALPLAEWLTFLIAVLLCYRHRPTALDFGLNMNLRAQ